MKSKSHFHFKKFSVEHGNSTMKVGTDAVLLGAWANVENARRILDIGTGTGTIALMLAQRTSADTIIDAVEIEITDAQFANHNFRQSPWADRIHVHHVSVQNFFPAYQYDVIVSNPPYFNNSQKPVDERRSKTRHTVTLNYEELLVCVNRLLTAGGSFQIILPNAEGLQFVDQAKSHGFFCSRQFSFKTRVHKPVTRWLFQFDRKLEPLMRGEILLYEGGEEWSSSYKALTANFYLKI